MALHHSSAEIICGLVVFHYAERRLQRPQPVRQRAEFQILYAARRGDQLYISDVFGCRVPVQLRYFCDVVVGKPLLYIRVETARLEKPRPQ